MRFRVDDDDDERTRNEERSEVTLNEHEGTESTKRQIHEFELQKEFPSYVHHRKYSTQTAVMLANRTTNAFAAATYTRCATGLRC